MLERRVAREPVQYIVGKAWFYGRPFYVDRRVLIPRPETELLVDVALGLRPRLREPVEAPLFADVGTGSGILAITLALELMGARVVATDVSREALQVASLNRTHYGVEEEVQFVCCDGLSGLQGAFDAIVSNPPYVRSADIANLQREVRDHEPHFALDGGEDGLDVVRRLVELSESRLAPGGSLLAEVGVGQADAVVELLRRSDGWAEVKAVDDLAGVPRVVCATRHTA